MVALEKVTKEIASVDSQTILTIVMYQARTGAILTYCGSLLCFAVLHGMQGLLAELTGFN